MQNKRVLSAGILVGLFATGAALGEPGVAERIDRPEEQTLNRFGVGYRAGFNISAKFKNLGGFNAASNPGPATPGVDHFYDDGYNRNDISGSAGDETWFWGYENDSQYQGDTIVMSSSSAPGKKSSGNHENDPQHGLEVTYNRELGRWGKSKWGIEGAISYTDVSIRDSGTLSSDVVRTNDAYSLGGNIPPLAPYQGTFEGPGPLLSTIPFRTVTRVANGATITGRRDLDADIFGLRVGPYVEVPMSERWALSFSGGFALLSVSSDFSFDEAVTVPGSPAQSSRGSGSKHKFLPGGYIGGSLIFALKENVDLSLGAQYQAAGIYSHKESGKKAELDLGSAIYLSAGIGFSF